MVSPVSANTAAATGASGGAATAASLVAQYRSNGALDTTSLAADLKAKAANDPDGGTALKGALEKQLTPVERGDLERALSSSSEGSAAKTTRAADSDTKTDEATTRTSVKIRKFDDADAFNAAANDAAPNTRYEYGSYSYTTDSKGRTDLAEGKISLDPTGRNDPSLQAEIGHEGKKTDIGFHLIGDRFGGQTNRLNVVPGNGKPIGDGLPNLNNGAYKQFENTVAKLAENSKNTVEMRIEPSYNKDNTSTRPDSFEASYRVNGGAWRTQSFVNK